MGVAVKRWGLGVLAFVAVVAGISWLGAGDAEANGPGSIQLPFPQGETWYVCQGYNQPSISHGGVPDLDLTVASNGAGPTGCTTATANSSTGRTVTAPRGGSIVYRSVSLGFMCINLNGGGSIGIGHLTNMASGSVSEGQTIGKVAGPNVVANGGYAHIHLQAHDGTGCGSSPRDSFSSSGGFRFCGNDDMPYSGAINQYSGKALRNPTGGCTPVTVPSAPRSASASAGNTTASVSWSAPSSTGGSSITKYEVTSSPGGRTCSTSSSGRSCTVTGLTNGTSYAFSVRARNSAGLSPAATTNRVTPTGPPSAPRSVSATPSDSSALVSWTAPSLTGGSAITAYEIKSDPGGRTCDSSGSARSCTVTGLANGTAYRFSVQARNAKGLSPTAWTSWVVQGVPPSEPLNVGISGGSEVAVVTWSTPAEPGTGGVHVWQVLSESGIEVCSTSGGARACTVSGLTNGVTYRFKIRGTNAYGVGPAAWTPYVTPNPGAVIDLSATPPAGYDPFDDDNGSSFEDDIEWMAYHGVTLGCGERQFCLDSPLTRQELAAFVARVLDLTQIDGSISFADVDAGNPFKNDILKLATTGITEGCATSPLRYCPSDYLTREQFASFWSRALRLTAIDPSIAFSDVSPTSVHRNDILKIATEGITLGCGADIFCPGEYVRRDTFAAFVARTFRDDPAKQTWLLRKGTTMVRGDIRHSADGLWSLRLDATGFLTIRDTDGIVWAAYTANRQGTRLVMQGDGNLVLYRDNTNGTVTAIWSTFTDGNPGAVAVLGTDGKLRILSASGSALKTYG